MHKLAEKSLIGCRVNKLLGMTLGDKDNIFSQEAFAFKKSSSTIKAVRIVVVALSLYEMYVAAKCAAECYE